MGHWRDYWSLLSWSSLILKEMTMLNTGAVCCRGPLMPHYQSLLSQSSLILKEVICSILFFFVLQWATEVMLPVSLMAVFSYPEGNDHAQYWCCVLQWATEATLPVPFVQSSEASSHAGCSPTSSGVAHPTGQLQVRNEKEWDQECWNWTTVKLGSGVWFVTQIAQTHECRSSVSTLSVSYPA